jgi:hypothetical protein
MTGHIILMLSTSDNGVDPQQWEKNRRNAAETEKALDESFKELWAQNEHPDRRFGRNWHW